MPPPPPPAPEPARGTIHRNTAALTALLLFLVGLGAGWFGRGIWDDRARGGAPAPVRADPTPVPPSAAPAWSFREVSPDALCGPNGPQAAGEALRPAKSGPLSVRLGDETLDASPIDAWQRTSDGPLSPDELIRPWETALVTARGVKGHGAYFNSDAIPGGFTHAAFEFRSPAAAASAGAETYRSAVCDWGARPAEIQEQRGIAVATVEQVPGELIAWWVHGDRLVTLNYILANEREADLQAALVLIEAAYRTG